MSTETTKTDLTTKYEARGAQKSTLQEYIARQKKSEKQQFKLPKAVKFILLIPVWILCAFGLFFIPYLMYKAFTTPTNPTPKQGKAIHIELTEKTPSKAS